MKFVYLSPHFPTNYIRFTKQLSLNGVQVLGLADEPYDLLDQELKQSLTEYYNVSDMHVYDELLRGLGYFTHKYGKIDRIDSHNEYWLETEAQLRTDFNIPGIKSDAIAKIKRKSSMKKVFQKAGIPVAQGQIVKTEEDGKNFIEVVGFPVVAKPDIGVGAAKTYKIKNLTELSDFFTNKPDMTYIMEEFIDGNICSFDGLADKDGKPVFYTSHQYSQGVMETVNNDDLIYYYSLREIPADLENLGKKTLKAFNVSERFFHFEFFRTLKDNRLVALEVNMRPPGGLTTDMFNFANDIDIYHEWAQVIIHNRFTSKFNRPYHCCYIGRKFNREYDVSHENIVIELGDKLTHHEKISGIFSQALGDYGYLVRSPKLDEIFSMVELVQKLK